MSDHSPLSMLSMITLLFLIQCLLNMSQVCNRFNSMWLYKNVKIWNMTIHGHDLMLIEVICAVGRIYRMNQRLPSFSTTWLHHSPYAAICNNKYFFTLKYLLYALFYLILYLIFGNKGIFHFQFFFAFAKVSVSATLPLP